MMKDVVVERWQYAVLVLGVSVCLIGAFLMVAGESILGESHTGIASLIGIVGIGIISSSNTSLKRAKAERRKA
jgi:hypothetical protein